LTDAQIALYAAVRVAVPGEWRVSLHSYKIDEWRGLKWMGNQVVYFERPIYAEDGPVAAGFARYFRLPNRQIVGTEKLAVACDWPSLEENTAEVVRNMVWEAKDLIRAAD
jgi:hypothetical protein